MYANLDAGRITPQKAIRQVVLAVWALSLVALPLGAAPLSAAGPQASGAFIIQGASADDLSDLVMRLGGTVTSRLDLIHGVVASLTPAMAARLLSDPGLTLTPNHGVQVDGGHAPVLLPAGKNSLPTTDYPDVIGADAVWNQGITGAGITVAVVDSGIAAHPSGLKNNRIVGWVDFVEGKQKPLDPNGHGTFVAGVIANADKGSDGEWNGVAPEVRLVGVRVVGENGTGSYESVIRGIQWVVANRARYNIRVMNISLSAAVRSPYWADPVNQAVMAAWANGIVVVTSAGNEGPGPTTIGVPGNNPYAITVGAFTDAFTPADWSDDYVPAFSAAGPTLDGFVKPDLVAPGGHIVSTMPKSAWLALRNPDSHLDREYFAMSGTSPAAAVVSGVVALMLQQDPSLAPNQVKHRLRATALPQFDPAMGPAGYSVWQQGSGRVFAPLAVFANAGGGSANGGMNLGADLAGAEHYLGYSYRDDLGNYRVFGDDGAWAWGAGTWDGVYASDTGGFWADAGFWADSGFWADAGYWADGGFWADTGYWADGGFWADGEFRADSGFWADGGFWADAGGYDGTGGFWADGASFGDEDFAVDGGFWADGGYWADGGFWADRDVRPTAGFWADGGYWADGGFWADSLVRTETALSE